MNTGKKAFLIICTLTIIMIGAPPLGGSAGRIIPKELHKEIGEKVGGSRIGTPLFLINGQVVEGANIPQIEKILGAKK